MYTDDGGRKHIVTSMCFTTRHDYGLDLADDDDDDEPLSSGMNIQQREALYGHMDQLYDHHINPLMRVLTEISSNTTDEAIKQRIQLAIKEIGHG